MALLSLSGSVRVTRLNKFEDGKNRNFEGDSQLSITVNAASLTGNPVRIVEAQEWWCSDGGWVITRWVQSAASPWRLNPLVPPGGVSSTWTFDDCYDPLAHVILMARVTDPTGAHPDEWVVAQTPVAIDATTSFAGAVERAPAVLPPPRPDLIIGAPSAAPVHDPAFLAVRAPVEVYDLVSASNGDPVRQRTLVVAGQIVNWFKNDTVRRALGSPTSIAGPIGLKILLNDQGAGRMVVDEQYFDAANRRWSRNLGSGENHGFWFSQDDRVAAFLVHCPVPETFSFGELTLEFVWPNGSIKRTVPVRAPAVDVLHWPVRTAPLQKLAFTNGLSAEFTGHTRDLHQHLAYDITIEGASRAKASFGARILAPAAGRIAASRDDVADADAETASSDEQTNRVFMEHLTPDGPRYTVCAHVRRHTVQPTSGFVTAEAELAEIGNNGPSSGAHLHLAHYRLDEYGRLQVRPMAFAFRSASGSSAVVGVPAADLVAAAALDSGEDSLVVSLVVHLTTGSGPGAGTDDDVVVSFGGRQFLVDRQNHDDFERAATDGFNIAPWSGLRLSGLRGPLRVHKSPDGSPNGGWVLDGVKVVANGTVLFDRQGLNTILSSAPFVNRLDWTDTIA